MADLGNAWHLPDEGDALGLTGMRNPTGFVVSRATVTIWSGNQDQGDGGNPGNQLQVGSAVLFRRATDPVWQEQPIVFRRAVGHDKYYAATLEPGTFQPGDTVEYCLRIAYEDHDTTFVHRDGAGSATTGSEGDALATPFVFTVDDAAVRGLWGPVLTLPNVAIHSHVLPSGRVLMWGRRPLPGDPLDVQACSPFVWDPKDGSTTMTPPPLDSDDNPVNLFCSGHTFLPDGRLFVVGGHREDSDGISYAGWYDHTTNTWQASTPMTTPSGQEVRRWYPTATMLPDGTVLVASGSFIDPAQPPEKQIIVVDLLQIWDDGRWRTIDTADGMPLNFLNMPLYPRLHLTGDGRVFMSGPNDRTLLLTTAAPGGWTEAGLRPGLARDYCPAVLYDIDKVVLMGGGHEADTFVPTDAAEIIDLAAAQPAWERTASMTFPRRQHNATVLPDGTVLVTGGTRGGGGENNGFNDLTAGAPVHQAELWDPTSGEWTELASEEIDRCYHSTAVLLPDATVLSAGGGEYRPGGVPNAPEDTHRDAQVFTPPYLFRGPQPRISALPSSVDHGETLSVETPDSAQVTQVSLVSLASVTHSFDEHQRIVRLPASITPTGVSVLVPASENQCPSGHYMVFLLTRDGVPSIASIIRVTSPPAVAPLVADPGTVVGAAARFADLGVVGGGRRNYLQIYDREAEVAATAQGTRVTLGITGTCPYGIGSCWGGAYEALQRLDEVDVVAPIPNPGDSTAEVYLRGNGLPPLAEWDQQFRDIVGGSYELRGAEVALGGRVDARGDDLFLVDDGLDAGHRPAVRLVGLTAEDKIQWNHAERARRALEPDEAHAFERLRQAQRDALHRGAVTVTGPLTRPPGTTTYDLHVRLFAAETA